MAVDVKPGQWIQVKIVARPRSAAGVKTMQRLFGQDIAVRRERRRQRKSRAVTSHIRGGRDWMDRPARLQAVKIAPGVTYKIFGSIAALRDLAGLSKCVEVAPA